MSAPDMLVCPFCGDLPCIEHWHGGAPKKRLISCKNEACAVQPCVTGETKTQAVLRWNYRPDGSVAGPVGQAPVRHGKSRDVTPTWSGLLPLILTVLHDGSDIGRCEMGAELASMAGAADRWNDHCRKQGKLVLPSIDTFGPDDEGAAHG